MVFRSLNLKIVQDRGDKGLPLREALWNTHQSVNLAVAEIERVLLLCRGREYYFGENELKTKEQVLSEALAFARKVQATNQKPKRGTDQEVLSALQELYHSLVPSVLLNDQGEPQEGDAKSAGGFASPLMDKESKGFADIFNKIVDPLPAWVESKQAGTPNWEQESLEWLKSDEGQKLLRVTGRNPAWIVKVKESQPWQDAFCNDQAKKREEVKGIPRLVKWLKEDLGLLPLLEPPVASKIAGWTKGLTPWDRLSLRLAVSHLLSWESWNHRAAKERREVQQKVESQKAGLAKFGEAIEHLRQYEQERHQQIMRVALATEDNPYKIGMRAIRGWDRVLEKWRSPSINSKEKRIEALAELQTKLSGKFGDPELFRWLAEEKRVGVWRDRNPLPSLARLNSEERLLRRKKGWAIYTSPEARMHPRWLGYEPLGGSNLRNYDLAINEGKVSLTLPLLAPTAEGLKETKFVVALASSGQLQLPSWMKGADGERRLQFRSSYQDFIASPKDSEILFSRRHLENRAQSELNAGRIGPVWFKLVIDVESQAPPSWLDGKGRAITPPAVNHFKTALANTSKHSKALEAGLRVLTVDLGLRTFAACSVFELVQGEPKKGMAYLADKEKGLWAKHERSFLLSLDGEAVSEDALTARAEAYRVIASLRRQISQLRQLLQLLVKENEQERLETLGDLAASFGPDGTKSENLPVQLEALVSLRSSVHVAQPEWEQIIRAIYRRAENMVSEQVSAWRRFSRPRAASSEDRKLRRAYDGGKSIWSIEYLEHVRRILQGWTLRGRTYGKINRANRKKQGTFATKLLNHINALKTDRIKSGSDLIIQAARGFVAAENRGWVKRYEACRLILLEDLARYRFRTDRPRRENSQLVRWSHREIQNEVTGQASIYGIVVDSTGAGFTSRFHAKTGAPGCRIRTITERDLGSPVILQLLQQELARWGLSQQDIRPGMRIPWEGGPEFATLDSEGRLVVVHADLNAAQNLQRRFWTRHGDAYRFSAVSSESEKGLAWYPQQEGVRLRGALAQLVGGQGYARLVPVQEGSSYGIEAVKPAQWKNAVRGHSGEEEELEEGEGELLNEVLAGNSEEGKRGEEKRTFFRDPSGLVLPKDRWYEAKVFWGIVNQKLATALGLRSVNVKG